MSEELDFRCITETTNPLVNGTPPKVLDASKPVRWEVFRPNGEPYYIEVVLEAVDHDHLWLKVRSSGVYPMGQLKVIPRVSNEIYVCIDKED